MSFSKPIPISPLPHQTAHIDLVTSCLKKHHVALDASGMGTGKTVTSYFAARNLGVRRIVVVCPIGVDVRWREELVRVLPPETEVTIMSYNTLKGAPARRAAKGPGTCASPAASSPSAPPKLKHEFLLRAVNSTGYSLPPTIAKDAGATLLIADECHNAKNDHSVQTRALAVLAGGILRGGGYALYLSATPFDKPEHIWTLLSRFVCGGGGDSSSLTRTLYDRFGVATRSPKSNNRGVWAENLWTTTLRTRVTFMMPPPKVGDKDAVVKCVALCPPQTVEGVENVRTAVAALRGAIATTDLLLSDYLQEVEVAKAPVFARAALAVIAHSDTTKVILFLNYLMTQHLVVTTLRGVLTGTTGVLHINGSSKPADRVALLAAFQAPSSAHRVLVCTASMFAEGVELDDKHGGFPRVAFLSPSYHMVKMHQATGRIFRLATTRSPAISLVVFASTEERDVMRNVIAKSATLKDGIHTSEDLPADYKQVVARTGRLAPEDPLLQCPGATALGLCYQAWDFGAVKADVALQRQLATQKCGVTAAAAAASSPKKRKAAAVPPTKDKPMKPANKTKKHPKHNHEHAKRSSSDSSDSSDSDSDSESDSDSDSESDSDPDLEFFDFDFTNDDE